MYQEPSVPPVEPPVVGFSQGAGVVTFYRNCIIAVWLVPQRYQILLFFVVKKVNVGIIWCSRVLRGADYKLIRELEVSQG